MIIGWGADAMWASLIDRHPLVLIGMDSSPKYLVLTVNHLGSFAYYGVATARLMITKPLMWLVGGWYGNRAVAWAARRSERSARTIRWMEGQFGRLGWVIVLITSNNVVCLLAGSTGFPLVWFLVLALVGTLARLALFDLFGARFSDPIDHVVDWVGHYRIPVVCVSIAIVVIGLWWQHRSGTSSLDELAELERDTDGVDDPEVPWADELPGRDASA